MNRKQITLLLLFTVLFVSSAAIAQDANKYHGGSHDGFAKGTSIQYYFGEGFFAFDKYHGGSYDGFAMEVSDPDQLVEAIGAC